MAAKCQGTVKWFSNRKGFGFIAPTSDHSPTKEDIFVHQTSIVAADGEYRTLQENATVEFEVEKEAESGKFKAVNVTGLGGTPLSPPPRERRRRGPRKADGAEEAGAAGGDNGDNGVDESKENGEGKKSGGSSRNRRGGGGRGRNKADDADGAAPKPKDPPFHSVIKEEIRQQIGDKGVDLGKKSTVDISFGDARIKLGQGGYAGYANASAVIGEGTYTCDENALVTFEWQRSLACSGGEWKVKNASELLKTVSLNQDGIGPVKDDETAETLWGADKPDPKEAFESNGFLMRRVVLTRPRGSGGGRGRGGQNRKKNQSAKNEAE